MEIRAPNSLFTGSLAGSNPRKTHRFELSIGLDGFLTRNADLQLEYSSVGNPKYRLGLAVRAAAAFAPI